MNRLALPSLLLAGSLLAAGCADAPSGAAEPAQESRAETRTVTHARGTTEVPGQPRRVVVLDTGELDSALALGVTPVGAVRAPTSDGLLSYLRDETRDVEIVGEIGDPDLEAIAALRPDLILGSDIRVEQLYDELSAIAPTVFTETVGVTWKENLLLHAEALGKKRQARRLLAAYESRAEQVGSTVPDDTEVSVVRFVPGEIRLYARESFVGTVLDDAGIARPAAQDVAEFAVTVSPEQIGKAAGDHVFVATYGDPAETDQPDVLGGPLWRRLPAVRAGDVTTVDDDVWMLGIGIGAAQMVLDDLETTL